MWKVPLRIKGSFQNVLSPHQVYELGSGVCSACGVVIQNNGAEEEIFTVVTVVQMSSAVTTAAWNNSLTTAVSPSPPSGEKVGSIGTRDHQSPPHTRSPVQERFRNSKLKPSYSNMNSPPPLPIPPALRTFLSLSPSSSSFLLSCFLSFFLSFYFLSDSLFSIKET